jgi:hypothetical protein
MPVEPPWWFITRSKGNRFSRDIEWSRSPGVVRRARQSCSPLDVSNETD